MKRKSTYQLKRSEEFTAKLFLAFFALLMTATAVNSCNSAHAGPHYSVELKK